MPAKGTKKTLEKNLETKVSRPVIKKFNYKSKSKFVATVQVPANAGDLVVLTKVKNLVTYIFQITKNSPKKFRFTFVNRLQNYGLDIIENIYRANEINLKTATGANIAKRVYFQQQAMTELKLLEYMANVALNSECIIFKQYEQIARQGTDCIVLLANWIQSDKNRTKQDG